MQKKTLTSQEIHLTQEGLNIYETVRNQALKNTISQQMSVILYHGVLHGLQILVKAVNHHDPSATQAINAKFIPSDNGLVRVLTNMILYKKSEFIHVY